MRRPFISTIAAVGMMCALGAASTSPALAAENPAPRTVEQDVAQLEKDVDDLYGAIPSGLAVDPLYDSPFDRSAPRQKAAPIPGCTEGALLTYANQLVSKLSPVEQEAAGVLSTLGELYALGVADDENPQVFGTDGQYTQRATTTVDRLRGFWDIESWNISVVPWKGTDTASPQKMTQAFALGFGPARAATAAALANKVVGELPALQGGRNPALTLNAYSSSGGLGGKRVILGDGILDATDTLGFDAVSVETVLGHEYGHQVDFANENYPNDESAEMGPDAYSGYFVTHPKGFAYDARKQQEVTYLDASIGDCQHSHGTPAQRKAAGAWGEQVAAKQANPGRIVPSATMVDKWKKEYPKPNPTAALATR